MSVRKTNIECSCGESLTVDEEMATVRCDCGELYAVTVTQLSTWETK